jgi:lon-related putative ATP-dependent protease
LCAVSALPAASLIRRCDLARLPFATTDAATGFEDFVGQDRALEALRFGLAMRREGYNLYAMGPPGVGKETLVRQLLARRAQDEPAPSDWCYVHNFRDPQRPRAIELPPGYGAALRVDMEAAVAALRVAMRAAFESEELRTRMQRLETDVKQRQEMAFGDLQRQAQGRGIAVFRTETGVVIAPTVGGNVVDPAWLHRLPELEQASLRAGMETVGGWIQTLLRDFHDWGRDHLESMKALHRETSAAVAKRVMGALETKYAAWPVVVDHLSQVESDVVENASLFLEADPDAGLDAALRQAFRQVPLDRSASLRRYGVNVVIDNGGAQGPPVVHEPNPTLTNLIGRIGHVAQFGALVTDFSQIKAGALHRARGGYLLVDALHLLQHGSAWEALKRALRAREVRFEPLGSLDGLGAAVPLEPEPVPLAETKVILIGERTTYGLVSRADPDFLELFKVIVDFDEAMERTPESEARYATLIASLVRKEGLRALDRAAVGRVIEHAARLTGEADKISLRMRPIADLLREADAVAVEAGSEAISEDLVQATIDAMVRRAGRVRARLLEAVQQGRIMIDSDGERIGQVNGLSVIEVGEQRFGHPTRITARVRVGKGEVVDIEREVEMGGPIHSKGVLILAGLLGARYAPGVPLSLTASIVFEQSYVPVEGDSASLAELCALLSALAELPIRQSFAVTGSVNQHGDVQPVGGVNEKIEGFFDVCEGRGLTGRQGVLIPQANVKDLMLRREVVEAVAAGRFAVVPVGNVDDAIAWLIGREPGGRTAAGRFPEGSINALVESRLVRFAECARGFLVPDASLGATRG